MGKFIYTFFWWFGGANIKVLLEHPLDHNKYFQIGMSVFTTAVMATFTSLIAFHYAINRGFEGDISLFAIVASIFWGFLILNLDRFLVLSMTKQGSSLVEATAFERFQNFLAEFSFAIPRIILAILIASVIVEPLELYLFAEQIKEEQKRVETIQRQKFRTLKSERYTLLKKRYQSEVERIKEKYQRSIRDTKRIIQNKEKEISGIKKSDDVALTLLKQRVKEESASYHLYQAQAQLEASAARGGCGVECKKAQRAQRESFAKIIQLKEKIEKRKYFLDKNLTQKANNSLEIKSEIKALEEDILAKEKNETQALHALLEKLKKGLAKVDEEEKQNQMGYNPYGIMNALHTKQSIFEDKKYNQIHQLLWLLLLVIELFPIILKLLFKRTSYDAHIQRLSEEHAMEHDTLLREKKLKSKTAFKRVYLQEHSEYKNFRKSLD